MKNISIIIPFYNSEKYLKDTIDCVKKQTLENIECILINDGSTDLSEEIAKKEIGDDSRFILKSQENKGVSFARNYGKKIATGEYILFLDSDDFFDSDMCEKMYNTAKEYDSDLVIFGIKIKNKNGTVGYFYNTKKTEKLNKDDAIKDFFIGNKFNIGVHTKLIRKDLSEKLQFEVGKKINEDKYYLFQALTLAQNVIYRDECCYLYVIRENSTSNSKYSAKFKDMIYFAEKTYSYCEVHNKGLLDYAYKNLLESCLQTYRILCLDAESYKFNQSDKKEIFYKLRKLEIKKMKKCKKKNVLELILIKYFNFIYVHLIRILYKLR